MGGQKKDMPAHPVALSVVVSAEGVERSDLHPAAAQLLGRVVEEAADVRTDLSGEERKNNNQQQ